MPKTVGSHGSGGSAIAICGHKMIPYLRPMACALLPLLLPPAALADCPGQTLISCEVDNGGFLEVCIEPGDAGGFTYRFGPRDRPELTLREAFSAGTAIPWSGAGRAIWEGVAFHNGDHVYEAWHSLDRLSRDPRLEAGVTILREGAVLAILHCKDGQADIAPVFAIQDAMAAAGYCRDPGRHEWRREGCD